MFHPHESDSGGSFLLTDVLKPARDRLKPYSETNKGTSVCRPVLNQALKMPWAEISTIETLYYNVINPRLLINKQGEKERARELLTRQIESTRCIFLPDYLIKLFLPM